MLVIKESAKIIRNPLLYNEQKVEQDQARILDAHNFLQEKEELTVGDKRKRFRSLDVLNERSKKHIVHLSVNFAPGENLTDLQMKRIATDFMHAIEFGDQPWLLYRHVDAAHPHAHIISTNIRPDGSRISNDLLSPHHFKQVCFQLEERYGLKPVHEMPDLFHKHEPEIKHEQNNDWYRGPKRIKYGEKPTRTAIKEVLEYVNNEFSFTCFDAYNALLGLYNVRADRGREESPMYQNKGLYYRLIDDRGKKQGAPIKASAFHLPVTIDRLEQKYQLSRQRVQESLRSIHAHIDYVLAGNPQPYSILEFYRDLGRHQATLVIPYHRHPNPRGWQQRAASLLDKDAAALEKIRPDDGHGFFYVNWTYKTVIRDTEAGEKYTAAAILTRTGIEKELRNMHQNRQFKLSNAQEGILRPDYPDTAEARRLLLRLSSFHSEAVEKQLKLKEEQELTQRRSHRMRHGL